MSPFPDRVDGSYLHMGLAAVGRFEDGGLAVKELKLSYHNIGIESIVGFPCSSKAETLNLIHVP